MFRKLIYIVLLTIPLNLFSQEYQQNSILVYSEGQGFFQPFISSTLQNLNNTEDGERLFRNVNSLNRFISDNEYQAELQDLIGTQKPENVQLGIYYTEEEKDIRKRIFDILVDYEYFLSVRRQALGELIEVQLLLYKTTKNSEIGATKSAPLNISDKVVGVEDVFINPKEPKYQQKITDAVQRLFENSNWKPEAILNIYGERIENGQKLLLPLDSEVVLDGSNSSDLDTPELTYYWRNIAKNEERYQTMNRFDFDPNKSKQRISVTKGGDYRLGFKVFDGIEFSDEIEVEFSTIERPAIRVFDTVVRNLTFLTLTKAIDSSKKAPYVSGLTFTQSNNAFKGNYDVLITNEKLGPVLKRDDESKVLSSYSINTDDKNPTLKLKPWNTKYNESKWDRRNKAFLYAVDSVGFLSKPNSFHYANIYRSWLNFGMKYQLTTLSAGEQNNYEKKIYGSMLLSLGFFVSKFIEAGLDLPLSKTPGAEFNGFMIYHSGGGPFVNYHLYTGLGGLNKPPPAIMLGLKYNFIKYDLLQNLDDFPSHLSGLSLLLGFQGGIKRFGSGLQLDYNVGFDYIFPFQEEINILTCQSFYLGIILRPGIKFLSP